jgi:hypothetical protein
VRHSRSLRWANRRGNRRGLHQDAGGWVHSSRIQRPDNQHHDYLPSHIYRLFNCALPVFVLLIRSPQKYPPNVDPLKSDRLCSFVSSSVLFKRCLQQTHCLIDRGVEEPSSTQRSCCLVSRGELLASSHLPISKAGGLACGDFYADNLRDLN